MRAVALLLVAPFLTLASTLAPQHIHEPAPGHGYEHAVAHSHFDFHDAGVHDPHDTEVERGSERVVWLDNAILHESAYRAARAVPAVPISYALVPAELRWAVTAFDEAAPAHGPPRHDQLFRGPPLSCLS